MSGYLERLVGRHLEPPAVRPRPVARFEGDLVGGTVQPEALASDGPSPARGAAPMWQEPIDIPSTTPIPAPPVPQSDAGVAALPAVESPSVRTAEPATPQPAIPATQPPRSASQIERSRHDESTTKLGPDRPSVTPAAIRRADPAQVVAGLPVVARPFRRSADPTPREPDVVHVHIGRVEVRATVPAPQPSRTAPRAPRPAPLSLDRYLAGERRS